MLPAELNQKYGHVLGLRDINISMPAGGIMVVMGLSGSGKSTLIRHINRLIDPTAGEVLYDGVDVCRMNENDLREFRRHKTAMVFQKFALLPHRTVLENTVYGLEIQGVGAAEREKRAKQWIERVGLAGFENHYPNQLSGGMQQRVGLARAFATGAPILLMDEPFSALDPLIRTRLQDELLTFQSRLKKTIVFVSHDLDEAMKIGNRIAILEGGRIIQCGTPQDILLQPANQYVADFVAHMNPLGVLQAGDIMTPFDRNAAPRPFAATTRKETLVRELMNAVADSSGDVGIVENGAIIGKINADDIVRALSWHQQRGQH